MRGQALNAEEEHELNILLHYIARQDMYDGDPNAKATKIRLYETLKDDRCTRIAEVHNILVNLTAKTYREKEKKKHQT